MGFGLLPSFDKLGMPSFMNIMDKPHQASKKIKDVRGIEPPLHVWIYGSSADDPAPGSNIVRPPLPTRLNIV